MTSKVPALGSDVSGLTTEQLVAWYSKHPNATVKSLVQRIQFIVNKHQEELLEAYAEGVTHGSATDTHRNKRILDARLSYEETRYLES